MFKNEITKRSWLHSWKLISCHALFVVLFLCGALIWKTSQQPIGVQGTTNTVAKFTGTASIGNSSATDDGVTWNFNAEPVAGTGGQTFSGGMSTDALTAGVISATPANPTQNDWNPTSLAAAQTILVSTGGTTSLTGIVAPASKALGRQLCLYGSNANALTLANESASSTAANRFTLVGAGNWLMPANSAQSICFVYDTGASRWKQIANTNPVTFSAGTAQGFTVASNGSLSTPRIAATGLAANNSMVAQFSSAAQTTAVGPFTSTNNGTYNTTAGALIATAATLSITSSRSAGGNNLTNIGVDASASGAQVNWAGRFNGSVNFIAGHLETTGSSPSASLCGSTPSPNVNGSDIAGIVTVGGAATTTCTLTFGTTYGAAPACVVSSTTGLALSFTTTATTLVVTNASLASSLFHYYCIGLTGQ